MNQEQQELRKKVEEKFGYPPVVKRHFELLSESIFEATHEKLSSTTLRRLWGYQEVGQQTSVRWFTLTLLARYAGYEDYDDFLASLGQEPEVPEENEVPTEKKRWRFPALALIVVLIVMGGVALYAFGSSMWRCNNYDFEQDSICYRVLPGKTNEVEVTYKSSDESYEQVDVTIPETVEHGGKTYRVTAIGDSAFFKRHGLIAVVLPTTIERIGAHAFHGCDNLSHLNMPDGVTSVGEYALRYCNYLNSVRLSSKLTEIPPYCFSHCVSLKSIELPQGVKVLSRDAFGDCFLLRNISLPEGLQTIERGVFWNCKKLGEITLPSTLDNVGDFIFWGCDSLKTVTALSTSPIRITDIFKRIKSAPRLYVPSESVEAYSKAQYWGNMKVYPLVSDSNEE